MPDDDPPATPLATELAQTLDALWAMRVVRAVVPFTRWAWPVRALVFTTLLTVVCAGGALVTREPIALLGLHLWAAALLVAALVLYPWLGGEVVVAFRDSVESSLPSSARAFARTTLARSPLLRWQALLSIGVGVLTAALLLPVLLISTGRVAPFTTLAVAIGSSLTTNLVYIPGAATVMTWLAREAEDLPALIPQHGRVVRAVQRTGHRIVLVTAGFASVGVLAPLGVPGLGAVGPALAALVLLGAVTTTAGQFVIQQAVLAELVSARRDRTLDELQSRINELYTRRDSLTSAERDELAATLSFHDRAANAPDVFASMQALLAFARPLVVPLVGAVFASLHHAPGARDLASLRRLLPW